MIYYFEAVLALLTIGQVVVQLIIRTTPQNLQHLLALLEASTSSYLASM